MKKTFPKTTTVIIFILCLSLRGLSTYSSAAALLKTADIVPAETFMLLEIADFQRLKEQFKKTNLYKLYKDPAMAPFVTDLKAKLKQQLKGQDDQTINDILNAELLPKGRVALALVLKKQPAETKASLAALLITQWGENLDKAKELVEKLVKKTLEEGQHKKTENYRGITITTIIKELPPKKVQDWVNYNPENKDVPVKTVPQKQGRVIRKIHYCFLDDTLLTSNDIDTLKFTIAHIKGATSPALSSDINYAPAMQTTGPYHDIDYYVNIRQLIKTAITEDKTQKIQTMITNLGLDNVTAFAVSIGVARLPESSYCGKAFLKINGQKRGICKIFDLQSNPLRIPAFIPASACSAGFVNLSIKQAYEEIANILASFSPQYAAFMYMPLIPPMQGQPGLQIKDDIIDHLGSQIIVTQSINKQSTRTDLPIDYIAALAVNNRSALERSVSLLYSTMFTPQNPDAVRQLLGHTIYYINLPQFSIVKPNTTQIQTQAPPASPSPQKPQLLKSAFTITDTHIIFANETTIEKIIRSLSSNSPSLASVRWFNTAKSAIPGIVGLASLKDDSLAGEFIWKMLKQNQKDGSAFMLKNIAPLAGTPVGTMNPDTSLLPEFDAVRKYFGLSTFYGISRQDGFFFEFKNLESNTEK